MAFEKLQKRWEREQQDRKQLAETIREALLKKGVPIFRKYGLKEAYLFGSVLNQSCHEYSDVDLFVCPLAAEGYWSCLADLSESIGTRVDLYTQSDDSGFIKKIKARGELIYEV